MNGKSKKVFAAAGVTLAVAAGAGGAIAAGGKGGPGRAGAPGPAVIAKYLGLTQAQLREQLRAGKTLAQIAVAQGSPSPASRTRSTPTSRRTSTRRSPTAG